MKLSTDSEQVFACYMRACAPPPVGKGGSNKGGRKAAVAARRAAKGSAVSNQVSAFKNRMKADKEAAKTYGVDKGKEGPTGKGRSASPETKALVKSQIEKWQKSGKAGDQRDEKATAKMLTAKYGTRGTGKGKNVVKAETKMKQEKDAARELTKKFGTRRG